MDFSIKFDVKKLGVPNHAKLTPHKLALITHDRTITFQELDQTTNAMANGFLKIGIQPGDRFAILMRNGTEIIQAWSAAAKIGVTPIAVNYRFKSDELAHIINDSESKALIFSEEFSDVVKSAEPLFANKSLVYIGVGKVSEESHLSLEALLRSGGSGPPSLTPDLHGVSSMIIYTSGTTGRPKGVFKTSRNRLNSLLGYAYNFESTYDDVHLAAGPLCHAAPYAWAAFSLLLGNTVVIIKKFDAEEFLRLVQEYRVTTTFVAPTMLNRILRLPESIKNSYDISSLRVMTMGGEACPFALKKRTIEFFDKTRIFEFYGGTETSVVTYLRPEDQLRKPGSCGKPVLGSKIKLLDGQMEEVAPGEAGVLYVKNGFLMDYYFNNPEATRNCTHNGYITMGDVARVDEDGYYNIVGRAVDMVLSGGVNIYPPEIEETLHHHPDIDDVAIIGAPDPEWGEKLVAFVVPVQGSELTAADIQDFVASRMASYKKPKEVIFVDEIPYSVSGKKLKRVLRETYAGMVEQSDPKLSRSPMKSPHGGCQGVNPSVESKAITDG
ncbi:MAG: AMP-binding protein [Proteobacteria bacterium]|nr:AMP-binding protein [Pseudomonadota bacterium]MBU2518401.1 AMP-binding protein [Pseudomonadota bacterium]